jgi:hypothetical protein
VADVYAYPSRHYAHHRAQLTLAVPARGPSARGSG